MLSLRWSATALLSLICACTSDGGRRDADNSSAGNDTTSGDDDESVASSTSSGDDDDELGKLDTIEGEGDCDGDSCPELIDILFVIDNSGSTGEEQLNLAKNFPLLIQKLEDLKDSEGRTVGADVNVMVTTTDFGNTYCQGTGPERGAPVATGCNERIGHFSNPALPGSPNFEESCRSVCEADIVPEGNFIHFNPAENNIAGDVEAKDVNGDGVEDGAVAQALACIGPQGIDGCGYEAPLESMIHALNPTAEWNSGETPFLRPFATLAVVMITDEVDCSVSDWSVMDDISVMEVKPDVLEEVRSSAICWNAGVECEGPDAEGVYSNCMSSADTGLHPLSRYTQRLLGELVEGEGKEVVMLGILGVPPVTAHNEEAPHEPVAGGVFDLEYRDWRDPQFPDGDILPSDWPDRDAAYKTWEFGIGPGCTGTDENGDFTGQAVPPVRIKEVCESLNREDAVRCCIESICDDDFSPAITCLTDVIQEVVNVG